jgi:MFS family permease
MFRRLQPAVGFGWAVRIIGFVMLATQVFAILLLRMRQEPQRTRTLIDPAAFTNVSFVILFPVAVLSLAAIYIPFFYISSYAIQDHLTDPDLGFYLIAILNAASIPGRIVPAALADKQTGLVNMSIIVQLVTGVLVFAWAGVHDRAGVIVLAIFFGFFGGATLSLFALLPIPFVPDERLLGTRMGMIYVFAGIGILFGSPVAGALVQHTTSYTRLQVFTGVLLLGGGFLTCLARLIHTKWRILVKF